MGVSAERRDLVPVIGWRLRAFQRQLMEQSLRLTASNRTVISGVLHFPNLPSASLLLLRRRLRPRGFSLRAKERGHMKRKLEKKAFTEIAQEVFDLQGQ